MFSKKISHFFKLYLSSVLLYGLGILLCRYLPYFQKTLMPKTQNLLLYLYLGYLIIAPFAYFFFANEHTSNKSYLFWRFLWRNITVLFRREPSFSLHHEEKIALLFILVKIFFLPIMINFFFGNISGLQGQWNSLQWYPFLFTFLFTIDTFIFSLGYAFESPILKNAVKSVEPTFFGWFVALICYPPFNSVVGRYVPWGANDFVYFWNDSWTTIFRIIVIFLLLIYVWATVALGLKSSNLTNRGIVTKFPYSVIRHPAYISKNLIWWLTLLPVITWPFTLGMLFWSTIYFARALTEERHLKQDPDYVTYCEKVKWKFIPKII